MTQQPIVLKRGSGETVRALGAEITFLALARELTQLPSDLAHVPEIGARHRIRFPAPSCAVR